MSAEIVVRQHIEALADAQLMDGRLTLLRLIAKATDTLADIDLDSGQKLATYLLQPKVAEEHRQLLPLVPKFAQWNAVRLGLADQLVTATASDTERQDVLRSVLGPSVALQTVEDRQLAPAVARVRVDETVRGGRAR